MSFSYLKTRITIIGLFERIFMTCLAGTKFLSYFKLNAQEFRKKLLFLIDGGL